MSRRNRILADLLAPLFVLATLTWIVRAFGLDMSLERRVWNPTGGWVFANDQPWSALFHYGPVPAWIVAVGSLAVFVASFRVARLVPRRRVALYFVLVMIVGPGLVVNSAFKEHWGRPRPMDLREFGGQRAFQPVWVKGDPAHGESFPSGHASTGFYFVAPFLVLRGKSRWAWAFLALGIAFGGLIGVARMVEGKHFLSDVIWAGGFVYLSALGIYYFLHLDRGMTPARVAPEGRALFQ